ncbi:ABC transporter ATP-binding protein [Pseudanabaena sp. FACHB-1998]|uniref:ABC transporter ATP-binding protein n=1 Tax=Pseudanabaena sp. FACHB-1998 TaxID=2692858 RepID=UPI001681A492|nr:ABC transporter ATP-binding protein [Pseudanabaena sp. FACHB-1998]MBD2177059.1 ABC transporter ATP-binding protein [Pseudanabaena sp. FACHB-1998]
MLLEVDNLTIRYGDAEPAVDRVTFHLQAGEALGLIGESGCGKSTIGRSLINLLPKYAQIGGTIFVDGEAIAEKKDGTWRGEKVGLIFQDPMTRLDPLMSIEDHGLEVLASHYPKLSSKTAKQRIADALKSVRIDPTRAKQYPHEFSGGMRQRVAISLSLLLNPVLLIADEPTTSLDVTVATEILKELTALRQSRSMGLLLVTHDLGMVAEYCDRIAVMYNGVIVETGYVEDIFRSPQHPYTQSLLASVLHFNPEAIVLPSLKEVPNDAKEENLEIAANQEINQEINLETSLKDENESSISEINPETSDLPIEENNISRATAKTTPRVILYVNQLKKHYVTGGNFLERFIDPSIGLVKAVDGIDLEIFSGETFGIIGESGSGKSTTGRAILQLIKPDRGSVRFNSVELTRLKGEQMRQVRSQMQMIFQDPRACFNPYMTVFNSVADPLLIHKVVPNLEATREKVYAILEKVGLNSELADRYPSDLSGGQLQRVAIARALITNPKLVICDEPVSMLDASIQSQVLRLMQDLKEEFKLTYVFITHDLAVAQFFCDRIAVMRKGKIVEQGSTEEVLTKPQHEYTKALIASIPRIPHINK